MLASTGYKFEIVTAGVSELVSSQFSLRELTTFNATRKAFAVLPQTPEATVLAADTLVALEGDILGKPRNLEHARAMLRRLSGRTHEVCTAVFIVSGRRQFASLTDISRITFHPLSARAIDHYLRTINPLDKAGAYAAQAGREKIIASIEGSVTNVIGLPMEKVTAALRQFGINPF